MAALSGLEAGRARGWTTGKPGRKSASLSKPRSSREGLSCSRRRNLHRAHTNTGKRGSANQADKWDMTSTEIALLTHGERRNRGLRARSDEHSSIKVTCDGEGAR